MSEVRYNYWCPNDSEICKAPNSRRFLIKKDESERENKELCPYCNGTLKLMGELPYGGIGKFNMMSPTQKQQALRKRSLDHAKKHHNPDDVKTIK